MNALLLRAGILLLILLGPTTGSPAEEPSATVILDLKIGSQPRAMAVSPDGALLAIADREGGITLRDTATGAVIREFPAVRSFVEALAFSPDSTALFTVDHDNQAVLYRLPDGRILWRFKEYSGEPVITADYTPDASRIVCFRVDGATLILDAKSGSPLATHHLHRNNPPLAGRFTRDGRFAVTAGGDKRLLWWEVASGRLLRGIVGYGGEGFIQTMALSPSGAFAMVKARKETRLIEVESGRAVSSREPQASCADFSPGGAMVATGDAKGDLLVMETASGRELVRIATGSPLSAVRFSPDGTLLYTAGSAGGQVRGWRLDPARSPVDVKPVPEPVVPPEGSPYVEVPPNPEITLDAPLEAGKSISASEERLVVSGSIKPRRRLARLTINGDEIVPSEDGSFSKEVELQLGRNTYEIRGYSYTGGSAKVRFSIYRKKVKPAK